MYPLECVGSMILSAHLIIPFVGALLLFCVPARDRRLARVVAIFCGALTFLASLMMLYFYYPGTAAFQFAERYQWIPSLGASYVVGVDGLSLWLVVLTTFLTLLVLIASTSIRERLRAYLGCILLLEVGMLGTFFSLDAFSFYVFWELMLIPMYFLIGVWGGSRRLYAAFKFVLYTAFGSLLMLLAIIYLAYVHQQQFGAMSFFLGDWAKIKLSLQEELVLFGAFALAFAIKIPVFPFHTWLPDAHTEAPTGGSVLLAGVLLKMGLYGLIRFGFTIFPNATVQMAPLFICLGVFGIIYGALVAWVQVDMKKLVAYSSISHLGFCVLGYAVLSVRGFQGCVLQMVNHGISTGALFFIVGVLYDRKHTRLIADYGGLAAKLPHFAVLFLVFSLSSIGLPTTNGFVGEFLLLLEAFNYHRGVGTVAVCGVVLAAVYMLSLYRRVCFGAFYESRNGDLSDLNRTEKAVLLPLLVLVFVIGLYPKPVLDSIEPTARYALRVLLKQPVASVYGKRKGRGGPGAEVRLLTREEMFGGVR